jgi:DNA recombination protein RmuC
MSQEYAASERVIPATPTTLIALLPVGCKRRAKNAQEVAELGKQLYQRVARLGESWGEVGSRLGQGR